MPITAADIVNGAALTLVDVSHVTWSAAELLGYLNEGIRATAFVKPDMVPKQVFVTLAAGVLQSIPADGIALLDIQQNEISGRVVTLVNQQLLDECQRFWPAGTREVDVEHYTADSRTPRQFKVYPPNDGTGSVEIKYGSVPAALTSQGDALPVPDTYQAALTNFVLARAYAKNTQRQDLTKSAAAMQEWGRALGLKSQAQYVLAPKVES